MFPYYLLILIPFFVEGVESMLRPNKGNVFAVKRSNASIITFFLIWFTMLALRSIECGTDLRTYEYFFNQTQKMSFFDVFKEYPIEQLYFLFNWIVAHIGSSFRMLIVLTAVLSAGITGWFYWKESEFAPLTILLFVTNACFAMFYSGLRQALAMLFVVPAFYLTKHKKLIPFILIVVVASFFHSSATIMFVLYPIFHIPLKSKYFVVTMIVVACFFFFNSNIFNSVLPFLSDHYMERYATIQETNGYGMWFFFIVFLVFAFLVPDEKKMTFEISGLRNILVLITLMQGFAPIQTIAMRMNYYFIMLFPIIIPKILNRPKEGWECISQLSKWGLVIFLTFFFFYKLHFVVSILKVWPYVAYWE